MPKPPPPDAAADPVADVPAAVDDSPAAPACEPGLYIVSTPIGNARDITLRALDILKAADVIACEDTRVTRKLLTLYGVSTPTIAYHEHNAERMRPRLIERLKQGDTVALVSDAGTPTISDPGYRLVREVREVGITTVAVPGASAVLTALASSGLPTDRFLFLGFLPAKSAARRKALADVAAERGTLVFYEAAKRLPASLEDMAAVLGPREAAVARELTKKFEEIRTGALDELAAHYGASGPPRGEVVVLVHGAGDAAPTADVDVDALLRAALARPGHSVKDAVAEVASATGRPRREVYARALELDREQ
jgi:16S rRNA (cytidine1402-2'-O)-methyltransferase